MDAQRKPKLKTVTLKSKCVGHVSMGEVRKMVSNHEVAGLSNCLQEYALRPQTAKPAASYG